MVKIMLVRGTDIRDISAVLQISITKVLNVLKSTKYQINPKQTHYDRLAIDEFRTYVGKKKNKIWLKDGEKAEETAEKVWDKL
jgi:hypothetical protein